MLCTSSDRCPTKKGEKEAGCVALLDHDLGAFESWRFDNRSAPRVDSIDFARSIHNGSTAPRMKSYEDLLFVGGAAPSYCLILLQHLHEAQFLNDAFQLSLMRCDAWQRQQDCAASRDKPIGFRWAENSLALDELV